MIALVRAELFKQRSTRTNLGLVAAMLGLVLLAVLLHALGLGGKRIGTSDTQLTIVFGRGEFIAVLFAMLLGAMSMTGEIRHGTIRPTFLATPKRGDVVAAKVGVSALIGSAFGLAACSVAAATGTLALRSRGIDVLLGAGDLALFIAGGAAAAALSAAVGVGVGAVVRNQVPTLIGICAWLLFVETLFVGDVGVLPEVGRYTPGAVASALSGQGSGDLVAPWIGALVLVAYAAIASALGWFATVRRDVV